MNRTILLFVSVLSAGFGVQVMAAPASAAEEGAAKQAIAEIHGAGKNADKIHGTITFTHEEGGLHVVGDVDGLSPGKHGIHIHEKADLSKPDLSSAGGHFNPGGASHKHSSPHDPERHAGDLGNLIADEHGHAHLDMTIADQSLTLDHPKTGVIGHSVIVHEKEDDYQSQPAGNSGGRIAGGKIVAKDREPAKE